MQRRMVLVPLVVLGLAAGAAQAAGQQEKATTAVKPVKQMVRVEKAHLELGKFVAGSEVVGIFVFHNDGDRPVKILRAKPT